MILKKDGKNPTLCFLTGHAETTGSLYYPSTGSRGLTQSRFALLPGQFGWPFSIRRNLTKTGPHENNETTASLNLEIKGQKVMRKRTMLIPASI
jgi:hypothetical protein